MAELKIVELAQKLVESKARWTPRENPISLLDVEKVKAMLNPTEPPITAKSESVKAFAALCCIVSSYTNSVIFYNLNPSPWIISDGFYL